MLNARLRQYEEEISGNERLVKALRQQLVLLKDELKGVDELYQKGFAAKTKVLQYQRTAASLEGDIGFRQGEIAKLHQRIVETKNEIIQRSRKNTPMNLGASCATRKSN